jgi:DNA-binding NarL/FixJ family response regulator
VLAGCRAAASREIPGLWPGEAGGADRGVGAASSSGSRAVGRTVLRFACRRRRVRDTRVELAEGKAGFLLKDTAPEELLAAIRTLAAGDALLAPGITRRLIREFAARPEPEERPSHKLLESLSARKREVLAEVAGGGSNAEIGERLHISAATAKTHVSRLLMKLDAHDRAQLVMIAYETRLVTPS